MRLCHVLPLLLLGLAAQASPATVDPVARIRYGDLSLADRAGRATLRARVATVVQAFCRDHEDVVTPQVLQKDRFFCLEQVRSTFVAEMPEPVRQAYRQALREAGAHGRRL